MGLLEVDEGPAATQRGEKALKVAAVAHLVFAYLPVQWRPPHCVPLLNICRRKERIFL